MRPVILLVISALTTTLTALFVAPRSLEPEAVFAPRWESAWSAFEAPHQSQDMGLGEQPRTVVIRNAQQFAYVRDADGQPLTVGQLLPGTVVGPAFFLRPSATRAGTLSVYDVRERLRGTVAADGVHITGSDWILQALSGAAQVRVWSPSGTIVADVEIDSPITAFGTNESASHAVIGALDGTLYLVHGEGVTQLRVPHHARPLVYAAWPSVDGEYVTVLYGWDPQHVAILDRESQPLFDDEIAAVRAVVRPTQGWNVGRSELSVHVNGALLFINRESGVSREVSMTDGGAGLFLGKTLHDTRLILERWDGSAAGKDVDRATLVFLDAQFKRFASFELASGVRVESSADQSVIVSGDSWAAHFALRFEGPQ